MIRVTERERVITWWRLRALVEIAVRTAQMSGSENWRGWEAILEATERMWSLGLDDASFLLVIGFGFVGEPEPEPEPEAEAPIMGFGEGFGVDCFSPTTAPIFTFFE